MFKLKVITLIMNFIDALPDEILAIVMWMVLVGKIRQMRLIADIRSICCRWNNVFEVLKSKLYRQIPNKWIISDTNMCEIMPYVRCLKLTRYSNIGKYLSDCPKLDSLTTFARFDITADILMKLTGLKSFSVTFNTPINDTVLRCLSQLTNLDININQKVSNESISILTSLIQLDLSYNRQITNSGISHLTTLRSLSLHKNHIITDEGIRYLRLRNLDLRFNNNITYVGLSQMYTLRILNLESNYTINDDGIRQLTNLVYLNLKNNKTISNHGISQLTSLTVLKLYDSNITLDGMKYLTKLADKRILTRKDRKI